MDDLCLRFLEHRHVPPERQETDAVLRLSTPEAQDLRPEPEAEGEHLHPEGLGEHEVPELVNEDQRAREDDEVEEVHPGRAAGARLAPGPAAAQQPHRIARCHAEPALYDTSSDSLNRTSARRS